MALNQGHEIELLRVGFLAGKRQEFTRTRIMFGIDYKMQFFRQSFVN
jgi:hypothetical protein